MVAITKLYFISKSTYYKKTYNHKDGKAYIYCDKDLNPSFQIDNRQTPVKFLLWYSLQMVLPWQLARELVLQQLK